MLNETETLTRKQKFLDRGAKLLFWSWNIIFLAFMLLGFAPQVLPDMLNAVRGDEIPANFLAYALILTLIPLVAVLVGFLRLRREPGKLFALGYGVEGPLMLLLAVRFFIVRQATPAVSLLLIAAGFGMIIFLWQLLDQEIDGRSPWLTHLRVIGLTLLFIIGLYVAVWLTFYVIPVVAESGDFLANLFREIGRSLRNMNLADLRQTLPQIPFVVLGIILFLYTSSLFIVMPVAVTVLYGRAWLRSLRILAAGYSQPRAVGLTIAILAAFTLLFVQANQQPQHAAFALLEEIPADADAANALAAQEETIRDGLLNAYLAPQRYISAVGSVRHISDMYHYSLNISIEQANRVQELYETIARPLLYEPAGDFSTGNDRFNNAALNQEPGKAAELYADYFDESITEGEHDAVVNAMRSTWSIDQARANWQAVDDREIYLTRQEVTVTEQGEWAEIELHEVYENQTMQRQEVVYYFSLPETAVITGVWLGDSDNLDERFTYRVSPRGAAQALYRNEVRRQVDPALVEQIGPRQYRLRVFPVEPMEWTWDNATQKSSVNDGPPMHMWLTYRALATDEGWPLPHLAELRNVYWNDESVRLLNGAAVDADTEAWLPDYAPVTTAVPPTSHRIDFPNGQSVVAQPATAVTLPEIPADLPIALVLDRSRSMGRYQSAVKSELAALEELSTAVDVYLTTSDFHGQDPEIIPLSELSDEHLIYKGGQNAAALLLQFDQLYQGEEYTAVFVLTDDTGYKVTDPEMDIPNPQMPVWMIHLNGRFPLGYDDDTLEAIQSGGGGVAGSINEAAERLSFNLAHPDAAADLVDGYVWTALPTAEAETLAPAAADAFATLAARRLILAEMMRQRGDLHDVDTLDQLHEIAIEHSIVTPYSSMIVLVNRQQENMLNQLEQQGDRFDREFEDVGETVPENPFTVTGVPEPEEWLLLGLAAAMLGWYVLTNRRRQFVTS